MTRLLDRLIRRDAGYFEGMQSGAAILTTSYGSPDRESILPSLTAFAQQAYGSSAVVFSSILARIALFSEATFQFQALDDKHLFGNTSLAILEEPWPDGTTGELLARNEQDASLAGQSYTWSAPGEDRLVRLRPDWTTIVSELVRVDSGGSYRRKVGYWVEPPKSITNQGSGQFYPADEVAHWAPIPDPAADFRGMSWLTPVYRDIAGDDGLTKYKIKYLENSASPNLLIRYDQKLHPSTIDAIRERTHARYGGVDNAFKTLVLDQGADITVIGNSLAQMDFSNVAAAGEQRILSASAVPGVLIGLEPLRGAGRGYQESMQKFANLWARPQWRSWCGAHAKLVGGIPAGNRLWFDTSDIAALQDGELERGQAALVRGQALLTTRQAGYTRESGVAFIQSGDVTKLKPDPMAALPGAGNVQHQLGQAQPGATATPLPSSSASLPVGSTSPGDGGNGTRPAPQLTSARRAITAGPDDDGDGDPQDCPACGHPSEPGALFCSQCGAQLPDGDDEPDDDDSGMARFDPSETRVTSGAGGGQWTAGGANPASNGKAAGKATATATAPAHGGGHAAEKERLHARAAEDREKARQLEKELEVLHHQLAVQHHAHAAAVKARAAAKAGTRKHAVHHRKATRHHRRARSLQSRISSVHGRITHLRSEARSLDAKAAAL